MTLWDFVHAHADGLAAFAALVLILVFVVVLEIVDARAHRAKP